MTDIRIVNVVSLAGLWDDWLLKPSGVLDESGTLVTSVIVALLTDRLADPKDVLPDPDSVDRRGWWGDLEAETLWDGWQVGCKNWLLARAKIVGAEAMEGSTLVRAEIYTRIALQPFVDKKLCSRIDVSAERIGKERIDVTVQIYRGPLQDIELRFQGLWTELVEELH